ncbi:MAG: Crp/Fnr family transcriptional regulator [Bacteroidetes bacterium]|jgi:CRP-like cAMP-binding protein|nr:Crp/Fnr family transcriptional regulator [Bacteroidota bacterium]
METLRAHIEQQVSFTAADWDILQPYLKRRTYLKRQYLLQAGDVCQYESFIVRGCMRAFQVDARGHEAVLQFGIENWWIADLNSYLTGEPARFHVEVLEDSEVIQIDRTDLETIYTRIPVLESYFRRLFQKGFAAAQLRLIDMITHSALDRYQQFLRQYPTLSQRIPQRHIAAYLGITPEHLSKIRQQLRS